LKNQVADKEKLGGKLSDEEKETISNAIEEKIKWLESNVEAEVEDFKQQKKELEEIVHPIMSKFYQNSGQQENGSGPGSADESDNSESDDKDEL